jgi:hypothetical protein
LQWRHAQSIAQPEHDHDQRLPPGAAAAVILSASALGWAALIWLATAI